LFYRFAEAGAVGLGFAKHAMLELPTFCRPNPRHRAVLAGTSREIDQPF